MSAMATRFLSCRVSFLLAVKQCCGTMKNEVEYSYQLHTRTLLLDLIVLKKDKVHYKLSNGSTRKTLVDILYPGLPVK